MTQQELDCAVAEVTGESLATIQDRGFSLDPTTGQDDDEPVFVILCPFCGAKAILAGNADELPEYAECGRCDTVFDYSDDEIETAWLNDLSIAPQRCFEYAA